MEINVPKDIVLYCNRVQLGQVLVNIIVNASQAIKASRRDTLGLIRITAAQRGQNIMISIENNGPDIPEDSLDKIFEPFYTTKDVGQGTGLGLSISYDIIVNKHHGSIKASSAPGEGVTFTITLPVIKDL